MIEIRSFRDLLRLFFIFRREFLWALVITVIAALAGAFLLPSKYESNARLLVKPGLENNTLPIEAANRQALIVPSTQRDPIVDEEKMLTGHPIIYKVAKYYQQEMSTYRPASFWKNIKFQFRQSIDGLIKFLQGIFRSLGLLEEQAPDESLVKKLEKSFTVYHETGSAVMEIKFTWDDPVIAQKIVAEWIRIYLAERSGILGRNSLYPFYEAETQRVSVQITDLKQKIFERLQGIDSFSVKERLENLTSQINKATEDRFEAQKAFAGMQTTMGKARQMLQSLPKEEVTERQISLNPTQQDLKLKLNELHLERARLQRTYKEGAPPLVQVEKNIASLEAEVARQAPDIQRSENRSPNTLVTRLRQNMQDEQLRSDQLAIQIQKLDAHIAKLSEERLQVLGNEPELSRLQRELQIAEQTYSLYADNLEKARIERALDESRISNIAIAEQATFNPARTFPKRMSILLLALPLGCAVGLLMIYFCYLLDQRIHDGGRIEEIFSIPLWASLPDISEDQSKKSSNVYAAAFFRLYGMLPLNQVATKGLTVGLTSARSGEGVSLVIRYLFRLLRNRGYQVRIGGQTASPGEIAILEASNLLQRQESFLALHQADLILLVVEARKSTVPMVENALSILKTAFGKVDGVIINRRQYEIPAHIMKMYMRLRRRG